MSREEKSLFLMMKGDVPVRVVKETSDGNVLEGIMAFTNPKDGSRVEVECQEDPEMEAIEVDPVQFCHKMSDHFPEEGIDLVFIDEEPHPLTPSGAMHALETTGDLTWYILKQSKDLVRESIRRLRRTLTTPIDDGDPHFRITWATGLMTSHARIVQEKLEQGINVYANNDLIPGEPKLANMILPINSEVNYTPILADVPGCELRLFVGDPKWVRDIVEHMEYRTKSMVQFWIVGSADGDIELLGPA